MAADFDLPPSPAKCYLLQQNWGSNTQPPVEKNIASAGARILFITALRSLLAKFNLF